MWNLEAAHSKDNDKLSLSPLKDGLIRTGEPTPHVHETWLGCWVHFVCILVMAQTNAKGRWTPCRRSNRSYFAAPHSTALS